MGYGPFSPSFRPSPPFSSYNPHLAHLGAIIQEWSTLAGGPAGGLPKKLRRVRRGGGEIAAAAGALFYEPILLPLPSPTRNLLRDQVRKTFYYDLTGRAEAVF